MGRDGTRIPPRPAAHQPQDTSLPLRTRHYTAGLAHGSSLPMFVPPFRRAASLTIVEFPALPALQLKQASSILFPCQKSRGKIDGAPLASARLIHGFLGDTVVECTCRASFIIC